MTREEVTRKNLFWSSQFNLYLVTHPEVLDQIPEDATIVILPTDDPELCEINVRMAQEAAEGNGPKWFIS